VFKGIYDAVLVFDTFQRHMVFNGLYSSLVYFVRFLRSGFSKRSAATAVCRDGAYRLKELAVVTADSGDFCNSAGVSFDINVASLSFSPPTFAC